MPHEVHTVIIGAGVTGLCIAHQLRERLGPGTIALLESGDAAGGYCRTDRIDGFTCDWGPNGFLDKEPKTLEWIDQLGLSEVLLHANEASARRYIVLRDRLVEIVPPPKFFASGLLGPLGMLRLCMEPLIPQRRDQSPESVYDFARRRIGRQAADNLVSAMVLGVFGGDARTLSLQHCFPVMHEMEREYGGLVKAMFKKPRQEGGGPMGPRGTLTTLRGGIGAVAEKASQILGDDLRLNAPVKSLRRNKDGYDVATLTGKEYRAQHVVIASPASRTADIVAELDDADLNRGLNLIPAAPLAVVTTGYPLNRFERDLDGFGFLIPPNQRKRALGCIWTSSVFDGFAPEGYGFLRTMIGGAMDPDAIRLSDDELLDVVARDVHPLVGLEGAPEFIKIYRHRRGIPQYGLNHGEILNGIDQALARHPGLHLTGNSYRGISMNDCIVEAYRTVNTILGE